MIKCFLVMFMCEEWSMIIKRKYEWFGVLYNNDPDSRKVIDDALEMKKMSEDEKKNILESDYCIIPAYMNIESGIPGESYHYIIKEFEKLDKENSYDNGLTFKDVDAIEYETNQDGTVLQMKFIYNNRRDMPDRIIGFVALECKDGKCLINEGWEMSSPM